MGYEYKYICKNALSRSENASQATEKRIALLEDKVEYEHIISDPARLLAKGSSAA